MKLIIVEAEWWWFILSFCLLLYTFKYSQNQKLKIFKDYFRVTYEVKHLFLHLISHVYFFQSQLGLHLLLGVPDRVFFSMQADC